MAESLEDHQPCFRGYAVLITNEKFDTAFLLGGNSQDPTRKGADKDDTNLQYIFGTKLKFQLLGKKTYKDVKKTPSMYTTFNHWIHKSAPKDKSKCNCISCKIQTTDHSQSECFVLAISTHGQQVDGKQEILFSDDIPVDLSDIIDKNCETLKGKPRIILLQLCRSDPDMPEDIIETLKDENCETLKGKPRIILLQLCRSDPDMPEDTHDDMGQLVDVKTPDESILKNLKISGVGDSRKNRQERETGTGERGDFHDTEKANESEDAVIYDRAVTGTEKGEKGDDEKGNERQNGKEIFDALPIDEKRNTDKVIIQDYYYATEKDLQDLPSDFLIVFPVVSGKKAIHDLRYGSWLIDELRKVVENYEFTKNPKMNFLTVLTTAVGKVARDKEGGKGQKVQCASCIGYSSPFILKISRILRKGNRIWQKTNRHFDKCSFSAHKCFNAHDRN